MRRIHLSTFVPPRQPADGGPQPTVRPESTSQAASATRSPVRRVLRPARFLACVLLVGAGIFAVSRAPWGCGGQPAEGPGQVPLTYDGVPIIRVLLTGKPLDRAVLAATGGYRLTLDGKAVVASTDPLKPTVVTRNGQAWQIDDLTTNGRLLLLEGQQDSFVVLDRTVYRGSLELIPSGDNCFKVVNHLDMESYLAGVLAKELYPSWSQETFNAQAVAARTFAMYHLLTFGESHPYDVGSTQSFQVYGGVAAETEKSWRAVRSTHGQVLTYGPEGDERIFLAQYSACCGGRVNAASAIRSAEDIEPLRGGQVCTGCSACSRYRWEPVKISKHHIYQALAESYEAVRRLSGISELKVAARNDYGWITWIDVLSGEGKSVRIRGEDLRVALLRNGPASAKKLYSMNCRLRDAGDSIEFYDGKGFGHGVGMCQWGAESQAVNGASAEQILQFYYPTAKIVRAY